ncbi:hypothetical protein F511_18620 [Dorcoceras hygrometricum]|uniref:Dystroglycan-like n=1 Tax=Dorcoceras hygrometricum TaxID=472368 RepID=A0A2Z7A3Y2_9LAMI|nr:hypothetical protein F511_18620 [Dorcoceras hygrometricum]
MAASFYSNSVHVDFDSVRAMDEPGMVSMFQALVASGLQGFLGCTAVVYEEALVEFFANGRVRDGLVISSVDGVLVEISEELFAETFELPVDGLGDLSEMPKDAIFDARSIVSLSGELISLSGRKNQMKFEYRLLCDIMVKAISVKAGSFNAITVEKFSLMTAVVCSIRMNWAKFLFSILKKMVTPGSKQAKGFAIQISLLLATFPSLELGESSEFPTSKILSKKTVHRFVSINDRDGAEEVTGAVKQRAVSKKRPAADVGAAVPKRNRTIKKKSVSSISTMELVAVAEEAIPIQQVLDETWVADAPADIAQPAVTEEKHWFDLPYEDLVANWEAERPVGSPRDRGAIIARNNTHTPSRCWIRTMLYVNGEWVVEPCADRWVKIPKLVISTEVPHQRQYDDTLPTMSVFFKLMTKRWADVCLEIVGFCASQRLLPVGSINFCRALEIVETDSCFASRQPTVFTLRLSQFCTIHIQYSLFSILSTADIAEFLSSIALDRTAFRSVQIAPTVVPSVQFSLDQRPSSPISPDSSYSLRFDQTDVDATASSRPPISQDLSTAFADFQAAISEQIFVSQSEISSRLHKIEQSVCDSLRDQADIFRNLSQGARQEVRTLDDVHTIRFNEFRKHVLAQNASIFTGLADVRQEVQAVNAKFSTDRDGAEEVTGAVKQRAVSKKRPAADVGAAVPKRNRTIKKKSVSSISTMELVAVAEEAIPIQQVAEPLAVEEPRCPSADDVDLIIQQVLDETWEVVAPADIAQPAVSEEKHWFDLPYDDLVKQWEAERPVVTASDTDEDIATVDVAPADIDQQVQECVAPISADDMLSADERMSLDDILLTIPVDIPLPSSSMEITKITMGKSIKIPGVSKHRIACEFAGTGN